MSLLVIPQSDIIGKRSRAPSVILRLYADVRESENTSQPSSILRVLMHNSFLTV